MSKTTVEKIESVQEQIRQLENQKRRLMQEQKERERKTRTKRLIERGAILESLIDRADMLTNEQIKVFLEKIIQTDYAREIIENTIATKPIDAQPSGSASANARGKASEQDKG